MKYATKQGSITNISADCVVVIVWSKGALSDSAKSIDSAGNKCISKIIATGDFTGKLGATHLVHRPDGMKAKRLLLLGGGERKKLDARALSKVLTSGIRASQHLNAAAVHFDLSDLSIEGQDSQWLAARFAQEVETTAYRYEQTKSKKRKALATKSYSITAPKGSRSQAVTNALKSGKAIGAAINQARELGNLPGNICTPTYLAQQARALGEKHASVSVTVLGEKQMQRLKMGSLLSVSAGSAEEAKLIVINYKGAKRDSKPYTLVGKGITFDTGGISLKPGAAMDEMKFDMCGAASVLGALKGVAELKLPINVVGVIAAAENMPGSKATKPGDIVTSMSGKTIEILNTDAEGRLVLCDALTYTERFKPRSVIDIATLTGAAVATFGSHVSALLSNNDDFAQTLLDCGENVLDPAWQLPLWDEYKSQLDSNFADIANIGGPRAGTITAACFLSRFTAKFKWAHLDIAGSAWDSGTQKGATGRPVGLLLEYLRTQKA